MKSLKKIADGGEFMDEMEMRSAHASFCSEGKGTGEPWLGWSFQRRNYSPVLFCLRMLYEFRKADAWDLYENVPDSERSDAPSRAAIKAARRRKS